MKKKTLELFIILLLLWCRSVYATTYYIVPGDTLVVVASSPEPTGVPTIAPSAVPSSGPTAAPTAVPTPVPPALRTSISNSGTAANPLVYDGHGAPSKGFEITGSYVIVQNWDISTQAPSGNAAYGVYVGGSAHNVIIQDNSIHELCREGVRMSSGVRAVSVLRNHFVKTSIAGIYLDGRDDIADGNEIEQTMQYPRKAGGKFANCENASGADADGIRFFGGLHQIRNNYIHNLHNGTVTNLDAHIDCFQTWGESGVTTAAHISGNKCEDLMQGGMIEGINGPVGLIQFDYNVLVNIEMGPIMGAGAHGLEFTHNSIYKTQDEVPFYSTASGYEPTSADKISDNIYYDVGGQTMTNAQSGGPTIGDNSCWRSDGHSCGSDAVAQSASKVDPQFVNLGSSPWTNADLHLKPTSPVPTLGAYPLTATMSVRQLEPDR